jgi:hypothetical protein
VIAVFRTTARRITFAITLSVMLHLAVLWAPYMQLPHAKIEFPPITARLEHLPNPAAQPAAKPETSNSITRTDNHAYTKSAANTMNKMVKTVQSAEGQPFPKHIRLIFKVHKSADGFQSGEIKHQLDIDGNNYTLKAIKQASGVASLRNTDRLIQTSHGKIGEHGLQPETFDEEVFAKTGKKNNQVVFDRQVKKLLFSNGDDTLLLDDVQDTLSFMYQLSQIPLNVEFFPLQISDTTHLVQYQIEIGTKEDISTPMGKLPALHLRQMHTQGEAYFEIWLGQEYRLLPVKFSQLDGTDKMIEEFVISDIRSTEE